MNEQNLYVSRHYVMDPEHEDLLWSGADLRVGMVVLIEDELLRGDPGSSDDYNKSRADEANRWCTVERIELSNSGQLVTFLATYGDGTKRKRAYAASYAWLVKLASMPDTP